MRPPSIAWAHIRTHYVRKQAHPSKGASGRRASASTSQAGLLSSVPRDHAACHDPRCALDASDV